MRKGPFSIGLLLGLSVVASADNLRDPGATMENSELRVSVQSRTGSIAVLDKRTHRTWMSGSGSFSFRHLISFRDGMRFSATFRDEQGKTIDGIVTLSLATKSPEVTESVDLPNRSQPISSFDFLPPFRSTGACFVLAADYTDGHLYPCGLDKWPLYNLDHIHVNALDMPWIGIYDSANQSGYSVMVDTPYDATLKCLKFDGYRAPLISWDGEKGHFGYRRSITYHFTARGGYVDLANAFRGHTRLGLLQDKAKRNPNIRKLYGAPELWDFYDNVSDRELEALGVTRCVHHVQDWQQHGEGVKVANRLGFVTEDYDYYLDGHPVSKDHPYLSGSSGHGYYDTQDHYVLNPDGAPRGSGDWWARCPLEYRTVAEQIIPARLKRFPTEAIYFDQITADYLGVDNGEFGGGSLEECWSLAHPATRTQWKNAVCGFLAYIDGLGEIPAAEHGKWWEVPYTTIFYGIPSVQWPWPDVTFPTKHDDTPAWRFYEKWGSIGEAYKIPMWDLVFHDSTIPMWYPWDVSDVTVAIPGDRIQEKKDAIGVLYGIPAGFMVNGAGTGSWFKDRKKFLTSYRDTCKVLEVLADQRMTSHRFVTPDRSVQETRWSDGTRIVVNLGGRDYLFQGLRIEPLGWEAKGPWGESRKVFDASAGRVVTTIETPGYRFTDRQAELPIAMRRVSSSLVRVNVDDVGSSPVGFRIDPRRVVPGWRVDRTKVYLCDPKTGDRLRPVPWTRLPSGEIRVEGLSGWIVLDVAD
jgi:hypothetical protein